MPKGLRTIEFSFGDETLTHYGGIALFQRFCRKLGVKRLLQTYIPWQRRDNAYQGTELLLCLVYSMVAGLQRISDPRILAYNRSFQKLLGLSRFPAENPLRGFLQGFSSRELRGLTRVHDLLRAKLRVLPAPRTSVIWDRDSTVLPLYGWTIQGARLGYNPRKHSRPSYHPVVCFEGHTQDTMHGMLRPGDTHPLSAAKRFFRACQAKIPPDVHRKRVVVRLRADAGCFAERFVHFLDEQQVGYMVVARMIAPLKARASRLRFRTFRKRGQ